MQTWITFLRGMNLGGRRLTNVELTAALEAGGATAVRTFLASGNAVLDHPAGDEVEAAEALATGLRDALGYDVDTFLRSPEEVRGMLSDEPFDAEAVAAAGKPQVILLHGPPDDTDAVLALAPDGDRFVLRGRDLHWLPAGGLADTNLDLRTLDRRTGGTTTRTRNTVERLASKFL